MGSRIVKVVVVMSRMVDKNLSQDVVNLGARRILAGPLVYTVAVRLSFLRRGSHMLP